MRGACFAIVGPSGVGKDTLIVAARNAVPELHVVRRVITRPSSAGGEDFDGVSEAEFAARSAAGAFVLEREAHGLRYGIPAGVCGVLRSGRPVLFNGSRAMLEQAAEVFGDLHVVHVSARREVLAARLEARGREDAGAIERRLERAEMPLPHGLRVSEIDNSGVLGDAVARLVAVLTHAVPLACGQPQSL